jgi:hypothetical protein
MNTAMTIQGYQIEECLVQAEGVGLYRGKRLRDQRAVLVRTVADRAPTAREIARLKREREVSQRLETSDEGLVPAPLGVEEPAGRLIMVYQDPGGVSLSSLMSATPMSAERVLALGVAIVDALGKLHAQGLVHKNLSPAALLVDVSSSKVHLCDLGLASMVAGEEQVASELMDGAMAYMAPEQTGRMRQGVDYRADFYSLGILLYELACGQRPFEASDAMGWIHCHIARDVVPAHRVHPDVPRVLSDIIMRLVSKMPEDRYQSVYGLRADLDRALRLVRGGADVEETFALGLQDVSDRFRMPQRLYGRDEELAELLAAFDRARRGSAELVMLDGPEGVGKTSLVQEAHKVIAQARGFFAVVEFDVGTEQLPYAPVVRALRGVLRQILTEPEHVIEGWRQKLSDALSSSASVLSAELPELALVLGPQQSAATLPAAEHASRFITATSRLVRALCDPLHPLVMVLDDIQWADEPSLQLISALLLDADAACLLVVATLRMAQLEAEQSPWLDIIQRLEQANIPSRTITLAPLTTVALNRLLSDTLQRLGSDTRELAQTVIQKTEGNPFFVKELLGSLYQAGAIRFDADRGRWEWDLVEVQAADMPSNVAHLLLGKIERLDATQRELLQLAACIGPEFELGLLLEVAAVPEADALVALRQLVELGLLAPVGEGYQHVMLAQGELAADGREATCRFSHDRVQQAARNLLDEEVARRWELAIGRSLRGRGEGAAIRAAGHLGRVLDLIEPDERLETARCLRLVAR